MLESSPPDSITETGLSAGICLRTESSTRNRIFSAVASGSSRCGLLTSFQYLLRRAPARSNSRQNPGRISRTPYAVPRIAPG